MTIYKDKMGRYLTKALFQDVALQIPMGERLLRPPFTLYSDRTSEGYICFRKTFVELMDPTGYQWAMKYLGDFEHWRKLTQSTWFQDALDVAMDELDNKLKSEALITIKAISEAPGDKQALPAARYLASGEWKKKSGAGRPSNQVISGELKRAVKVLTVEDEDAARIGLKVVK
jgi:hypothetical protein